jgi:predicted GH43/DUF377 family glycosyl hydrolase
MMEQKILNATVVREPLGSGNGYWVGCPGLFHDSATETYFLTYRIRRPRGVEPDRGGEVRIAKSKDLKQWDDVWTMKKDQVNTASIERSYLMRGPDNKFRYFTSFVAPEDGRWCVTVTKAESVEKLDVANMKRLFTAKELGLEGVKDPWVFENNGTYYMILSIAVPTPKTSEDSHKTLDIYNTGECVSVTAFATSKDLDSWTYQGVVFKTPDEGWDCYCRRINSILPLNGKFYAFYDGSKSHLENYEEKCALAVSTDLKNFTSLSKDGPFWTSPYATKSVRYCDVQIIKGQVVVCLEFAREDGAHDMRVLTCSVDDLQLPK